MYDQRKPSLSAAPAFITKGILTHTTSVSTPDELPPSGPSSSIGGYFSLSRSSSAKKRRPSVADATPVYLYLGPSPAGPPPSSSGKGMFSRSNTSRGGDFASVAAAGGFGGATGGGAAGGGGGGPQSPNALYEQVHELATKRIATLDYLRRAHEGRVYWFNTMLFTKPDLSRAVYHDSKKLSRRANNYFILGNSLPSILDLGTSSPLDYLKAFNHLLVEYETHIALPSSRQPTRGHSSSVSSSHSHHYGPSSTLSLGRIPKLFSRSSSSKPRRGSSSAAPLPPPIPTDGLLLLERTRSASGSSTIPPASSGASTPATSSTDLDLLPPLPVPAASSSNSSQPGGEEYLYLTTPTLPFEPDYYETFATLCDVLIDAYQRVLGLVGSPATCSQAVAEAFVKADAKVRKCVVAGVVREFEDAARGGVKREIAGLGREVLGGLL